MNEDGTCRNGVAPKKEIEESFEMVPPRQMQTVAQNEPMRLEAQVPKDGLILKIRDNQGTMMGTLIIDKEGVSFRRPNQKNTENERKLKWTILEKLMEVGFF